MTAVLAAVGVATLVSGFIVIGTTSTAVAETEAFKAPVCHATGSLSNPYENGLGEIPKWEITDAAGHGGDAANHPNDIIPAFAAGEHGGHSWPAFTGRNTDLSFLLGRNCETGSVTPVPYEATAATCEADGALVPKSQPLGVTATQDPVGTGPGTYVITFKPRYGFTLNPAAGVTIGDDGIGIQHVTVTARLTGPQCEVPTLAIPAAPQVSAPTCDVAGSFTLPADTVDLDWSISPTYTGVGSYTVRVDALGGKKFTDGTTYKTWPISVLPKLTGPQCEDDEIPPPVKDVCTNINGVQPDVPKGYTEKDGICTEIEVLPTESTDVCSNIKGAQAAVPAGLEAQDGRCVRPAEDKPDDVVGPDEVLGTAEAVPTAVDAGIGGPIVTTASTSSPLGQGLVGAGLVMLLLAGAMQMGRARGAHQV